MRTIKLMLIFILCTVLFVSCKVEDRLQKNTGVLADKDTVSSILKDLEDKENSSLADEKEVFWTQSGSLWHRSDDCSYLSNSKEIFHGTLEEARLAGKENACKRCYTTDEDKAYEDIADDPIDADHVFFTRDGELWHTEINCPGLLGADRVYNSSVETARELGKTSCCAECEK